MARHLRRNAVAYLALFVALSGSAVAATALEENSVLSKHIKNGAVKKADVKKDAIDSSRVKNASLAPVDRAPGFGAPFAQAGHNHDARYVNEGQANSVGPAMVFDTQRSVAIPLGSFNDCETAPGTELNFASGADDRSDFAKASAGLVLRFDDDPGDEDTETDVCSGVAVPPDYVSSVGLRAIVDKDADTGLVEQLVGTIGSDGADAEITGSSRTGVMLPLSTALNPGEALPIRLHVRVSGGDPLNDVVDIYALDFVYSSRQ